MRTDILFNFAPLCNVNASNLSIFQSLIQKYKFIFVSVNYWMTKEKRFVDNPIHPVLITSLNDFEVKWKLAN